MRNMCERIHSYKTQNLSVDFRTIFNINAHTALFSALYLVYIIVICKYMVSGFFNIDFL